MSEGSGQSVELRDVRFVHPEMAFAFDLDVPAGQVAVILGPSGAGKSTLLDLVAGFRRPDAGRIVIGGKDVTELPPESRPVSIVFQDNNLFAHLDVAANVGLGRRPDLRLGAEDRGMAAAAIARVGLAGKEKRKPAELSGGERQRVAIARALVRRLPVLLLDEPFASLGPGLRDDMVGLVAELHAEIRMTVLMVSHDPQDAMRLSAHVIYVEAGRIAAEGPAGELLMSGGPVALASYLGRPASWRNET